MAKKKYYAVKNGRGGVDGIYLTWDEAKLQVEGVPGVRYQGFASLEEAEAFLRAGQAAGAAASATKREAPPMPDKEGTAVAYVDGSYRSDTGEFGAGAVVFWQGEKTELSQKNDDAELAQMHNVAGEIMASVLVIRRCLEQHVPAVEIYHDYEGVGKWGTGQWKTNRPGTQAYARFCAGARQRMKITFIKVQGHSGDYWNDEADRLAKKALGIE